MKFRPLFFLFDSVHISNTLEIIFLFKKMQVNTCCSPNALRANEKTAHFFLNSVTGWNSNPGRNCRLSKETLTALHYTIYAFPELTKYYTEELKMPYILPGKF